MIHLRAIDLAKEHGLSTQAVRNYERDGCIPPAERTAAGYRIFTVRHAAALRAYRALVRGHGHEQAREVARAVHRGDVADALALIDESHHRLHLDRQTVEAVREVTTAAASGERQAINPSFDGRPLSVGALSRRIGVSPATLRAWERAGILRPQRDPETKYRLFMEDDIRDAELTHFLRRGGYLLSRIADVVRRLRIAGDFEHLVQALDEWRERNAAQGMAMLEGAAKLHEYIALIDAEEASDRD